MPVPAIRPLLPRPDLTRAVRSSIEACALTALHAPAGYGKTSAIALALAETGLDAAWYTAQLWHAGEFVEPLVAEVRGVRPDFGRLTIGIAMRRFGSTAAWAQRLGATFAGELAHIPVPIAIVFEDTHLLADDPAFADFVSGAMRVLPDHVHLVVAGRSLARLPLAEWLAQGRARIFDAGDLRFSTEETLDFAARCGTGIEGSRADDLRATFEGWPAGLALFLRAGGRTLPTPDGSMSPHDAYVIDANLHELAEHQISFLERTSVFETLAAPLLENDPTLGDVRLVLRDLERAGTMIVAVKPGEVYRLHALLRDALLERVRLRDGAGAVRALHEWAGGLLERESLVVPALFQYEHGGNNVALLRLLSEHADDFFLSGNGERASRSARTVARSGLRSPTLGRIEGMALRQRGETGAEAAFLSALHAARANGDRDEAFSLRLLIMEDRLARREPVASPELEGLLEEAHGRGLLAESAVATFAGWERAIAADFAAARSHARAALATAGGALAPRVRAAALYAYAATCLGDFADADAALAAALRELEHGENVVLLANTLVWYARIALLWGDVEAARDYAEQGEALSRTLDLPAELAGVAIALAQIAAHDGDRARCEHAAAEARQYAASAWYASDRERTDSLASLFVARSIFSTQGASAALDALQHTSASHGGACDAALRSDRAAYALISSDPSAARLAGEAARAIDTSVAADALDAVLLHDAAGIAGFVRTTLEGDAREVRLARSVRERFGALLERRRGASPFESRLIEFGALHRDHPGPSVSRERVSAPVAPKGSRLTKREAEILALLAQGLTNKEIAQRLVLSTRTVDTHVERVLSKLNVTSRTRAVALALRESFAHYQ